MKLSEFFTVNKWCQGATARNRYNKPVDPSNAQAKSYSLEGALIWLYGENEKERMRIRSKLWDVVLAETGESMGLRMYNDKVLKDVSVLIENLRRIGE